MLNVTSRTHKAHKDVAKQWYSTSREWDRVGSCPVFTVATCLGWPYHFAFLLHYIVLCSVYDFYNNPALLCFYSFIYTQLVALDSQFLHCNFPFLFSIFTATTCCDPGCFSFFLLPLQFVSLFISSTSFSRDFKFQSCFWSRVSVFLLLTSSSTILTIIAS